MMQDILESGKKLRVAAYCRVSTAKEEQESSYEIQVAFFKEMIAYHPNWEMTEVYADYGITGTSVEKRKGFSRMIEDCKGGKIDLILVKSLSRFARNTLDSLNCIRMLKERNIGVWFDEERINTLDQSGEMLITVLSALAQEESRNISENVKWGLRNKYAKGGCHTSRLLGYKTGKSEHLEIIPEEAEVVKYIFRRYLEGQSINGISKELENKGYTTIRGSKTWGFTTVRNILENEKYIGDVLSQKTYTVDYLSGKRVANDGVLSKYYVENDHEPIISREDFYRVKEEKQRRTELRKGIEDELGYNGKYSAKYALTSVLFCGECGKPYRRQVWKTKAVWRCSSRLRDGTKYCKNSPTIAEKNLHQCILRAINSVVENKVDFPDILKYDFFLELKRYKFQNIDYDKEIEKWKGKLIRLLKSKEGISGHKKLCEEILQKLNWLETEKKRSENNKEERKQIETLLNPKLDLASLLRVEEYDDALVRRLISSIKVKADGRVEIWFKVGMAVEAISK